LKAVMVGFGMGVSAFFVPQGRTARRVHDRAGHFSHLSR
jgi:hypothetical protein